MSKIVPFTQLTLEIPPTPLFRDSQGAAVVPQVPLMQLLSKFDGQTWTDKVTATGAERRQYRVRRLPDYLMLHLARFVSSGFGFTSSEKNTSIVTFPVRGLELRDVLNLHTEEGDGGTVGGTKYDLICSIAHDSEAAQSVTTGLTSAGPVPGRGRPAPVASVGSNDALASGTYRVHLLAGSAGGGAGAGQWYELQDLHVGDTMPQLVGLSESSLLIYERRKR
jgi:U4/U6.U5 tri-snRNP-associated protein 2